MLRRVTQLLFVLLAMIGLAAVASIVWFASGGIGARGQPGRLETAVARTLRSAAIPREVSRRANPVPLTDEIVQEGLAHFADHCAVCHGNDGRGETVFGRGMYPKPPDLRLRATQDLADGELFYIIENGVKLTGMPAFGDGTPESATSSWGLVHFIRRLPKLTPEEVAQMEMLNPRSPEEWRQLENERRSLEGEKPPPKPAAKPHTHKHGGH